MKTKILLLLVLLIDIGYISAQTTCDIDPGNFEFSMTLTAVLNFDNQESNDINDKVFAYINDQCRGCANLAYHAGQKRYYAYLSVFSNIADNESISFKIYDESQDSTYDCPTSLSFNSGVNHGVISDPYKISNNYNDSDLLLSNNSIQENQAAGALVGTLSISETLSSNASSTQFSLVSGEGDTGNSYFTIQDNQLLSASTFNYDEKNLYQVRIKALTDKNTSTERSFPIIITNVNSDTIHVPVIVYDTVHVPLIIHDTLRYEISIYEIDEINSVNEFPSGDVELKMYPNPAKDILLISASQTINQIDIFDASGKKTSSTFPYSNTAEIQLNGFSPGIYFVKIHTNLGEINKKLVVSP